MSRSFVLLLAIAGLASALSGCDQPTKHYTTMGCTPSDEQNARGCPVSYNCPSLTNRQSGKCYLFGKVYGLNDHVPDGETASTCVANVNCISDGRSGAHFVYAHKDCADFLQPRIENCVRQYELGHCCSTGDVCDDDRNKLSKCTLAGHSYYEGERIIIPGNPCRHCICAAGFDENNLSNYGNCVEQKCTFELVGKLNGGAIPVYRDGTCCPWEWRLPVSTDKLVKSDIAVDDPNLQCKYGDITMHVGESLEPITTSAGTLKCSCAIPPLAHCKFEQTVSN
ncbi:uncharacterized protein LOC129723662 [Wyeomyia smithii]|uniref:uncharacterized protein LOC129723662 n=1 Tax=Wyeomyia smithii TaxID=174621 RepID=UPI002467C600|nr:uncharacterized protein LOC129723662 [Wyeomyia smithii]